MVRNWFGAGKIPDRNALRQEIEAVKNRAAAPTEELDVEQEPDDTDTAEPDNPASNR